MRPDALGAGRHDHRRAWLKAVCLGLLLLALLPAARSESSARALLDKVGYDRLERLAESSGADKIAEFLTSFGDGGEAALSERTLRYLARSVSRGLLSALAALAVPVLASLGVRLVLGRGDSALAMLCRLACAGELMRRCALAIAAARGAMTAAADAAGVLSPVLAAVMTLTGDAAYATALSPAASLCVEIIEKLLAGVGLPMCALAAVVACAGGLSEQIRLKELFSLLRRAATWGVRLMLAGFVGLLAVEGRLAAARDTASAHVLRQALRGIIPYVGGSVSDSTGAMLESAATARSAVGVTGVALAASACFRPTLRLVVYMLSLRLASAAIEPVADPGIARIAAGFSDVAGMLVALCAGSGLLAALLAGTCLRFF